MKKLLLIAFLFCTSICFSQYNILDENHKIKKLNATEKQVDSIIRVEYPKKIYIQTQVWNEEQRRYETCEKRFPQKMNYENSSSNRTSRKE